MTKHRFSYVERYALWRAYDGRCFYCEKPLDFQDMTVDHIIPEWLIEHSERLQQLRQEYEIDVEFPGFQINDYGNWAPAHPRKCNARKGSEIFPKRMTLLLLQDVQRRLGKVRQEVEMLSRKRSKARLFGSLSAAIENKHLMVHEVREFVVEIDRTQYADEPLVLTFGLTVENVVNSEKLPTSIPQAYPYLCDWLELDLVKHLRSIITTSFHYTQPSERDGERLSVRLVFPGLHDAELERFNRPWWGILEAANFWEIFGEHYLDAFREDAPAERADIQVPPPL